MSQSVTPPPAPSDYERAAFLRQQPVWFAVHTWLRHLTFDQVVELWWLSQAEKATDEETRQRRLADPTDRYGTIDAKRAEVEAQ